LLCATSVAADAGKKPKRVSLHALRDFETCQKEGSGSSPEVCLDALRSFVKRHPKHAFEAGKLVRVHYMYWEALEFFASAQKGDEPTKKQCADRDLRAAVLSGLALPAHYPAVALAQGLVNGPCHKQLEPALVAQLKPGGPAFRANACPLLPDKLQTSRCRPEPETLAAASEVGAAPEPAPEHKLERTKAEVLAKSPALREAPPERPETTSTQPVHHLEDVFPSRPEGKTRQPGQTAMAELQPAQ
jgi:hypothetical protein